MFLKITERGLEGEGNHDPPPPPPPPSKKVFHAQFLFPVISHPPHPLTYHPEEMRWFTATGGSGDVYPARLSPAKNLSLATHSHWL